MNRNHLIEDIANDTYLKQYASVLCKSDIANDIWQEALLHICELDDDTFKKYSGNLKKYMITQMYLLNLHRIGKKKKALTNLCDSSIEVDRLQMIDDSYNYEIDETFNKVINIIESNVKESDMIIFFETINNNMRTIERELNIPYVTIRSKRKRVIDKIKELIK